MGHMYDLFRRGDYVDNPYKSFYETRAKNLNNDYVKMNRYKSHVLLIVNVSPFDKEFNKECEKLNNLKDKFKDEKFDILAFPSSQIDKIPVSDREMKEKLKDSQITKYSYLNFFNRVS
jgi:glutathione peroxidase-family protein